MRRQAGRRLTLFINSGFSQCNIVFAADGWHSAHSPPSGGERPPPSRADTTLNAMIGKMACPAVANPRGENQAARD
ncbi:MAG TPA: hypothetical protein VKY65_10260 [Alphaproteobacteria bacterium]|nr:hypothetical protein [Alphaproteobacteria bacterium]